MFTFTLTEVATGEETELKTDSRDVLKWEKSSRSNERYIDLLTEMSMTKFYRLAWISAKRQEVFTGKLADFEEAYNLSIPMEEAVRPTSGDPTSEE